MRRYYSDCQEADRILQYIKTHPRCDGTEIIRETEVPVRTYRRLIIRMRLNGVVRCVTSNDRYASIWEVTGNDES
jgi:DNA-binding IclR family transcriptional regulator